MPDSHRVRLVLQLLSNLGLLAVNCQTMFLDFLFGKFFKRDNNDDAALASAQ